MFDSTNQDLIMRLINGRKTNAFVAPLYVKNYNDRYGLNEIKQINNFNPSAFKVGFGVHVSLLDKFAFPNTLMDMFDPVVAFTNFDEDKQISEKFIIFEIGAVDINMLESQGNMMQVDTSDAVLKEGYKLHSKAKPVNDTKKYSWVDSEVIRQIVYYQTMLRDFLSEQQSEIRKKRIEEELKYNGGVVPST